MAKSVKNGLIEAVAPEEIVDTPIEEVVIEEVTTPEVEIYVETPIEEVVVEETVVDTYVAPPVAEYTAGHHSRDFQSKA